MRSSHGIVQVEAERSSSVGSGTSVLVCPPGSLGSPRISARLKAKAAKHNAGLRVISTGAPNSEFESLTKSPVPRSTISLHSLYREYRVFDSDVVVVDSVQVVQQEVRIKPFYSCGNTVLECLLLFWRPGFTVPKKPF